MSQSLRQRAWEWIENQSNFMTSDLVCELGRDTDISKKQVKSIVDCLVKKGCVTAINTRSKPYLFKAVAGATPSFTRQRTMPKPKKIARQRIWKAMVWRGNSRFTVSDIAEACGESVSNVRRYICDLVKYRYIKRIRPAKGGKAAYYMMLVYTGAKHPQVTKNGLYDPNRKITISKEDIV